MSDSNNATNSRDKAAEAQGQAGAGPVEVEAAAPAENELAEAQRQRDEYYKQLQRSQAEFLNYQKRARAQAEADRTYAVVPLAHDLIAVLDNFERASDAARSAGAAGIVEGLEMVHKQLLDALAKHGIERISALGQPFDPNQHEAITQLPDSEKPEGTVVAEMGKGYRLLDRVLRPAKVVVSIRPQSR